VKASGIGTVQFIEPMYALAVQTIPTVRSGSTKSLTAIAAWLGHTKTEEPCGLVEAISSRLSSPIIARTDHAYEQSALDRLGALAIISALQKMVV